MVNQRAQFCPAVDGEQGVDGDKGTRTFYRTGARPIFGRWPARYKRLLSSFCDFRKRGGRGFTLLELLVVVFILSAIAFSIVSLTDQVDLQLRFDDTKGRLENIRRAVVIDSSITVGGSPVISGFAADMGRLPDSLQELVEQGALPAWQYDATVEQWAGWRGPYLDVLPESLTGLKAFRDGWGNTHPIPATDALFFGWNFTVDQVAGLLTIQSYGGDGVADGAPGAGGDVYDADYPPSPPAPLVNQVDYQVNVKGWSVWIEFDNTDGNADVTVPSDLRLRVYYPQDNGAGGFDWPDAAWPPTDAQRDQAEYLSLQLLGNKNNRKVQKKKTKAMEFDFSSAAVNIDKLFAAGDRRIVVVRNNDGQVYQTALNSPAPVQFVPRVTPPTSTKKAPLFSWLLN